MIISFVTKTEKDPSIPLLFVLSRWTRGVENIYVQLLRMIYHNVSQFFINFDCDVTIINGLSSSKLHQILSSTMKLVGVAACT